LPIVVPPVDLRTVPVILPPGRPGSRSPHQCGGRLTTGRLAAAPVRLLDSVAGIGIDRRSERLVRFDPVQIDVFDGKAWRRVADQRTVPPGATGPFTQLLGGWIEDGTVVFRGDFDGQFGLFRWRDGQLVRLVDRTTVVPGGSATLSEIGLPTLADGTVWFWAETGGQRQQATLHAWRDGQLTIPAALRAGGVQAMSTPIARGREILFSGADASTTQGIYLFDGSRLQLLVPPTARTADGVPLGPLILGEPSRHDGGLLFVTDAGGQGRRGLWYADGQAVHAVVDPRETVIDDGSQFVMVAAVGPFADKDIILLQGHRGLRNGERRYGLYALRGCTLYILTEEQSVLDGRKVAHVAHMYPQAVVGGLVIYPVVFTDGGQATYAARLR
jgi:hypothetical protein